MVLSSPVTNECVYANQHHMKNRREEEYDECRRHLGWAHPDGGEIDVSDGLAVDGHISLPPKCADLRAIKWKSRGPI